MIIRIGCVDGNTYASDRTPDAEVQKTIDENDGYIFTGDLAGKRVDTVEEAMPHILGLLKYDSRNSHQIFSMVVDGNTRTFNVQHVVWYEYELDIPGDPWRKND